MLCGCGSSEISEFQSSAVSAIGHTMELAAGLVLGIVEVFGIAPRLDFGCKALGGGIPDDRLGVSETRSTFRVSDVDEVTSGPVVEAGSVGMTGS